MKTELTPHDLLVALLTLQSAIDRRSESFFQPYGLSAAQFNILNLLAYADGAMDQLALTERLLVGKSSISIVLNRMVKAGLITRGEHAVDRRQVVLTLTRKGQSLWKKISARYEAQVEEVFGSLPEAKRARFLDDLETLYAALKTQAEGAKAPTLRESLAQLASKR
jgi:MarR family 2-MHQ and catechol resistance regulon transcriptional repressor